MVAAASDVLPDHARTPIVSPIHPETMLAYITRLKAKIDADSFAVVDKLTEDGLYISKRAIRGAEGQGALLNQAGTVFYHTLLYIKSGDKVTALEYSPHGSADVTANVMEAAPSGPIVLQNTTPDADTPLLYVKLPCADLGDSLVQKAIRFAQSRKYHAIKNNCIHNTDFFCRILTGGKLRNAPLIYDALAGKVPQQDHPMLLMFFLMTQLSWFHVCDGSDLTAAFMEQEGLLSSASDLQSVSEAKDRLQEKQVDLMRLIQGLQNGTPGNQPSLQ